jgi:lysophospholipase L1-like esterase
VLFALPAWYVRGPSRDVARAPEHYVPNDGHFSAAGNAVMGQALAERLVPLLRE